MSRAHHLASSPHNSCGELATTIWGARYWRTRQQYRRGHNYLANSPHPFGELATSKYWRTRHNYLGSKVLANSPTVSTSRVLANSPKPLVSRVLANLAQHTGDHYAWSAPLYIHLFFSSHTCPSAATCLHRSARLSRDPAAAPAAMASIFCAICHENINQGEETEFLPCSHGFHKMCLEEP